MNLKDIIQQDLDDIFFDENEFAEKIDFCGVDIVAIKSVQTYKDKYLKYSAEQGTGTYKNGIALIFKQNDLKIPPEPGDEVEVDGIIMFVVDVEKIKTLTYRVFLERIDG
ncbi:hypothetical protein [Cetobacterium sp.]|uniref:hypothetical protein n=1 Tax=Cetobacterium sp. TaxID=2071632 RepID=UPI003F2EEFCD